MNTAELETLLKSVVAGTYNVAPTQLTQGAAQQIEDCSPLYTDMCFQNKHIFLQNDIQVKKAKSTFVQFNRFLSYGNFGGSANIEGAVGPQRTSQQRRFGVPMCYYSEVRQTTLAAQLVDTQSGESIDSVEDMAGQMNLAGDVEFDCFRGCDDFSNAGVFDGNPNAIPSMPNILGLQAQIRQSDAQLGAMDLMFYAYGANYSVVVQGGGIMTQGMIEDVSLRASLAFSQADTLYIDPTVNSAYNKGTAITGQLQRILLGGSAQQASGADLKRQWTFGGEVQLKASNFLRGKSGPDFPQAGTPGTPSFSPSQTATQGTTFLINEVYQYKVSSSNDLGEGPASAAQAVTISASANDVRLTITPNGSGNAAKYFNVYRSFAGGVAGSARFIGRVANSGASTTVFIDLNNKIPGFVTGVLADMSTMDLAELAPYSKKKLAEVDLSTPSANFRFVTLRVKAPRMNVLLDNLKGSL